MKEIEMVEKRKAALWADWDPARYQPELEEELNELIEWTDGYYRRLQSRVRRGGIRGLMYDQNRVFLGETTVTYLPATEKIPHRWRVGGLFIHGDDVIEDNGRLSFKRRPTWRVFIGETTVTYLPATEKSPHRWRVGGLFIHGDDVIEDNGRLSFKRRPTWTVYLDQ